MPEATEYTEDIELIGLRSSNNSSFPRKRESSKQTFLIRSFFVYWIPACAGMTNGVAVHSVISVLSVAKIAVACLILLMTGCTDNGSAGLGDAAQVTGIVDASTDIHDGKTLFELYCIACHGAGPGHPGTMRLQERVGEEQAALLDRDNLPPEYIKLVVREGFKLMPPFRPSEISDEQLDELAVYITGEAN